jgi:hypothetical protein
MCLVSSGKHFTPKGVSIWARPGGYKPATTTWLSTIFSSSLSC